MEPRLTGRVALVTDRRWTMTDAERQAVAEASRDLLDRMAPAE